MGLEEVPHGLQSFFFPPTWPYIQAKFHHFCRQTDKPTFDRLIYVDIKIYLPKYILQLPQISKEEPSRAARRMVATEKLFGGGRSSTVGWCRSLFSHGPAEEFRLCLLMSRSPVLAWRSGHLVAPVLWWTVPTVWTVHGPYPVRMQLCVTASRLIGCNEEKVCRLQSSSGLDISFRMLSVSYDVPCIII